MKERLVLAVSWWAFLHAAVLFMSMAARGLPFHWRAESIVEILLTSYYVDLFREPVFAIGFPIATWVLLWIVTGNPRILPWR